MKWFLIWGRDFKSHFVPDFLKDDILENLTERKCTIETVEPIEDDEPRRTFDLPGPMSMNRHLNEIDVCGLRIAIPSTDIAVLYEVLSDLGERREIPRLVYYKLHGTHCLCLTPELRTELLEEMEGCLRTAAVFRKMENEQWNSVFGKDAKQPPFLDISERDDE